MRDLGLLHAAVLAVVFSMTPPALARPDGKSIGVGAESPLGFWGPDSFSFEHESESQLTPSLSILVPATDIFDLQAMLGTRLGAGSGPGSWLEFIAAVRGVYRGLPLAENVDMGIFFGAGYEIRSFYFDDVERDHFVHMETGIRPEWFIRDWISLHTQVGVSMGLMLGQAALSPTYDPGVSLAFFGFSSVAGKAGFTLWF